MARVWIFGPNVNTDQIVHVLCKMAWVAVVAGAA